LRDCVTEIVDKGKVDAYIVGMTSDWTPAVGWQQTALAWDDGDWTLAMYPSAPLSKHERKAAKKAAKRARRRAKAERAFLDCPNPPRLTRMPREVMLEDVPASKLRVIFCDFDGVLNQHSSGKYELLHEQVERLDRLARETGAVVVVSSWWRWIGVARLRDDLASAGFHGRLIGRTPWMGETEQWDALERGIEIDAVLRYLGERVESFVILDDHNRMGDHLPFLVQTTAVEGLSEDNLEAARRILEAATPRDSVAIYVSELVDA
jgi:hypothetical protein